MVDRGVDGRFLAGASGNPGGRPAMPAVLRTAAQDGATEAVAALRRIVNDARSPAAAVVLACRELLDRAYGRSVPEFAALLRPSDGAAPAMPQRLDMRLRLEALFRSRCEVLRDERPIGGGGVEVVERYRMPDGRVVGAWEFGGELDAWVAGVLVALFGPDVEVTFGAIGAEDERHPDDHFDYEAPIDGSSA